MYKSRGGGTGAADAAPTQNAVSRRGVSEMAYRVEIDDRMHEVVRVEDVEDVGEGIETAIAEWMDRYGEKLRRSYNVRVRVYEGGEMKRSAYLSVEEGEAGETGSDGEVLLYLVLGEKARAHMLG
jgi:hypothetical protein